MPIVNRPVPELKAGWPSASAAKERDFVSFAMMFAVHATGSYIGTIGSPAQAFRLSVSSCWRPNGVLRLAPTGTLSAAMRWSAASTAASRQLEQSALDIQSHSQDFRIRLDRQDQGVGIGDGLPCNFIGRQLFPRDNPLHRHRGEKLRPPNSAIVSILTSVP